MTTTCHVCRDHYNPHEVPELRHCRFCHPGASESGAESAEESRNV